jgi:hypothetical protein
MVSPGQLSTGYATAPTVTLYAGMVADAGRRGNRRAGHWRGYTVERAVEQLG